MIDLDNLTPEEALALTNALALSLAKGRTPTQINSLGNILTGVASLMFIISAQQTTQEAKLNNTTSNDTNSASDDTGHANDGKI